MTVHVEPVAHELGRVWRWRDALEAARAACPTCRRLGVCLQHAETRCLVLAGWPERERFGALMCETRCGRAATSAVLTISRKRLGSLCDPCVHGHAGEPLDQESTHG